jgi:hypothetical protein
LLPGQLPDFRLAEGALNEALDGHDPIHGVDQPVLLNTGALVDVALQDLIP